MKKLFTLLAICLAVSLKALAFDAHINIDDVSRVGLEVNYKEYADIHNGLNDIPVQMGDVVRVYAREGCLLQSVVCTDDRGNNYDEFVVQNQYCELRFYSDYGDVYTVTSATTGDARTASYTITVDRPDMVDVVLLPNDTKLELSQGANTLKFDPTIEKQIKITSQGRALYKVAVDGTDITATSDYAYTIDLRDGLAVEVEYEYPDRDCAIHFTLQGQDADDFIRGVDVDGRPVFNYMSPDFKVKAGSQLTIYGRTDEYDVTQMLVNGVEKGFYSPYNIMVADDMEISISVRKISSFYMTIIIDHPERMHVYRGYSYNGVEYQLQPGENTVEVQRLIPIVSIVPVEGFYVQGLEISDGYVFEREEMQVPPIMIGSLADNMVLEISTGVINRDMHAALFVNDLSEADGYFSMLRADHTQLPDIAEGYNFFDFYDFDNKFILHTGAPAEAFVYVNDRAEAPTFPGGTDYTLDIDDGDIVKVFYGEMPDHHDVAIDCHADIVISEIRLDHLRTLSPSASTITSLPGSHVAITAAIADGTPVIATLDGQPLAADADGRFCFSIAGPHKLALAPDASGITDVEADAAQGRCYDLRGIATEQPAPAGIYIRNGKKTLVR